MKTGRIVGALAAIAIASVALATRPPGLGYEPAPLAPGLPPADDSPILIAGTEQRIVLAANGERTRYAVVYLHGFSASRQETRPLAEDVAAALAANLFEVRFSGHGLAEGALEDVRAEDWLDDTVRAIAAGAALGDEVVIIATSTGASLVTALFGHAQLQRVHSLVFISPNFGARNEAAKYITAPGGRLLLRAAAGKIREWQPQNSRQARYWTTRYPTAAIIEMQRVVDRAIDRLGEPVAQPIQVFYSRQDEVVSPAAIEAAVNRFRSPLVELNEVTTTTDASAHVLVGDILSPGSTDDVSAKIVAFVRHRAP